MTWFNAYLPGGQTPEFLAAASNAEAALTKALRLHPNDLVVLETLATLSYTQAMRKSEEDPHTFDDAVEWYRKLITADPLNQEAYFTLGQIAWSKVVTFFITAKQRLGMKPREGPIQDERVKEELKKYLPEIEEGIANLEKALEIDPEYDIAMPALELLIRDRADLRDTVEEYQRDIKTADQWQQTARDAQKRNREAPVNSVAYKVVYLPELAEEPQADAPGGTGIVIRAVPGRILVSAKRQETNLIHRVEPVYPELARNSRIQGTVRLRICVDNDGNVTSTKVVSGDPLLTEAAQDAVRQWKYKPMLLNGLPAEPVTTVDVKFTLDGVS
jgi:TonB family protein